MFEIRNLSWPAACRVMIKFAIFFHQPFNSRFTPYVKCRDIVLTIRQLESSSIATYYVHQDMSIWPWNTLAGRSLLVRTITPIWQSATTIPNELLNDDRRRKIIDGWAGKRCVFRQKLHPSPYSLTKADEANAQRMRWQEILGEAILCSLYGELNFPGLRCPIIFPRRATLTLTDWNKCGWTAIGRMLPGSTEIVPTGRA